MTFQLSISDEILDTPIAHKTWKGSAIKIIESALTLPGAQVSHVVMPHAHIFTKSVPRVNIYRITPRIQMDKICTINATAVKYKYIYTLYIIFHLFPFLRFDPVIFIVNCRMSKHPSNDFGPSSHVEIAKFIWRHCSQGRRIALCNVTAGHCFYTHRLQIDSDHLYLPRRNSGQD